MKTNLFILLFFTGFALMAQDRSADVVKAVEDLATRYNLDQAQLKEMYTIEERKERNLAEIAPLEATDYREYLVRRQTILRHSEGSIRRFLTQEQRLVQDRERAAYRLETSNLIKEYQRQGKTKAEIEQLLLERS